MAVSDNHRGYSIYDFHYIVLYWIYTTTVISDVSGCGSIGQQSSFKALCDRQHINIK